MLAHLVLPHHDRQVVGHQAELLLQRRVGALQLGQLRLRLLRRLLRARQPRLQLGELRLQGGGVVLRRGSVPVIDGRLVSSW